MLIRHLRLACAGGLLLLFTIELQGQTDTVGLAAAATAFNAAYLAQHHARLDSLAETYLPRLAAAAGRTSLDYANAVDSYAETLSGRGNLAGALALLRPLSDEFLAAKGPEAPLYLRTQSHIGHCRCKGTDIEPGLEQIQAAVAASRDRAALPELLFLRQLSQLASCQTAANRTGASLQTAQELERLARSQGNDDYLRRALNNQGDAYMYLGRKQKTLDVRRQMLELTREQIGEDHPEYAVAYFNFAYAYMGMGDPNAAEADMLRMAELVRTNMGETHVGNAYAHAALGEMYYHQGKFEKALPLQLKSLEIMADAGGGGSVDHAIFEDKLAGTLLRLGRVDEALERSRRVDKIVRGNTGLANASYGGSALSMMMTHEMAGHIDSAFYYLKIKSESVRTRWINEVQRYSFDDQEAEAQALTRAAELAMSFAFRHPELPRATEHALDQLLLRKGLSLVTQKRMQDSWRAAGNTELAADYADLTAVRAQLKDFYQAPPQARPPTFDSLATRAENLERRLSMGSALYRQSYSPVTTADVRAALAPDEAYLELHDMVVRSVAPNTMTDARLPEHYVAYLVRPDGPVVQLDLFDREALPAARKLRAFYAFEPNDTDNLYALFTGRLLPHLDGVKTLYYSPAGQLHGVNVGALPVSPEETLADRVAVRRLTGSRSLLRDAPNNTNKTATLFGGLDYDRTGAAFAALPAESPTAALADNFRGYRRDRWESLPYTKTEVDKLGKLLKKADYRTTTRTGSLGTEEAFKALATGESSPTLLHLATHGYFFPKPSVTDSLQSGFEATEHPLIRSGLVMAGANAAWSGQSVAEGKEDGILTAYEIAQLDLSGTELVVLSACETGLGDVQNGDGIYGLQRAFKLAGARYVLVSLWSVDDKRTAEFMTEFYRRHLEQEQSIPAAYQATQAMMRERYNTPFNPRAWAGFVLLE